MNFAEQLKSSVDIVRTVGEYVPLKKVGSRFVGLCPFHTEKTPSFNVNPSLGRFICFGCGEKGDVLDFVKKIDSLTFVETLQVLAERNGIQMPKRREADDPDTQLRAAVFAMHDIAARAFTSNLAGGGGAEARAYLTKRGLSPESIEHFGLGFSERSGQDLLRRLRPDFTPQQLEASGLVLKRDDGTFYDRFRGRLMFPIHNESGKLIGFGGRTLRAEEEPKYLNSPETVIYRKSDVLYNLHRAKDAVRKNDRAVLVEGYMDVIGVYSSGVRQVVASCGTALTPQQVRIIKRHSQQIVVNFDPDNAGANAAERSIQMLLEEGLHVQVLELSDGLDPDEFIQRFGAEVYSQKLRKATRYFIWLADRARKKFDMQSSEGRMQGFEALLMPAIRRVSDRLERAAIAAEVASYLGVDQSLILGEFRRTPNHSAQRQAPIQQPQDGLPATERIVLRSILLDVEVRELLLPRLAASETARNYQIWPVLTLLIEMSSAGSTITYSSVEERLTEHQKRLLSSAFFADNSQEVIARDQAFRFIGRLEAEDRKAHIASVRAKLREAERNGDSAVAFRHMEEIHRLTREQKRSC